MLRGEPSLIFLAPIRSVTDCGVKTLATEAEVDSNGWLNIHAPAPPGTAPGKIDAVVVLSSKLRPDLPVRARAGTLAGKVELAPDFHEPLEDFRPYME